MIIGDKSANSCNGIPLFLMPDNEGKLTGDNPVGNTCIFQA